MRRYRTPLSTGSRATCCQRFRDGTFRHAGSRRLEQDSRASSRSTGVVLAWQKVQLLLASHAFSGRETPSTSGCRSLRIEHVLRPDHGRAPSGSRSRTLDESMDRGRHADILTALVFRTTFPTGGIWRAHLPRLEADDGYGAQSRRIDAPSKPLRDPCPRRPAMVPLPTFAGFRVPMFSLTTTAHPDTPLWAALHTRVFTDVLIPPATRGPPSQAAVLDTNGLSARHESVNRLCWTGPRSELERQEGKPGFSPRRSAQG